MKVGYNPVWAAACLVIGTVCLGVGVTGLTNDSFNPLMILGPLLILAGVLMLVRTYFVFDPDGGTIVVSALAGPATRRFGGSDGGRLAIADNRVIYTHPDGRTRKVPVLRELAKRHEWEAVLATIR